MYDISLSIYLCVEDATIEHHTKVDGRTRTKMAFNWWFHTFIMIFSLLIFVEILEYSTTHDKNKTVVLTCLNWCWTQCDVDVINLVLQALVFHLHHSLKTAICTNFADSIFSHIMQPSIHTHIHTCTPFISFIVPLHGMSEIVMIKVLRNRNVVRLNFDFPTVFWIHCKTIWKLYKRSGSGLLFVTLEDTRKKEKRIDIRRTQTWMCN